jgi:hypothetical protein
LSSTKERKSDGVGVMKDKVLQIEDVKDPLTERVLHDSTEEVVYGTLL